MAGHEETEKLDELMGQALGKVVVGAMKLPLLVTFASMKQTESISLHSFAEGKTVLVSFRCLTKHPSPQLGLLATGFIDSIWRL